MKKADDIANYLWDVIDRPALLAQVIREAREEMREECIKAAQPFGGYGIEPAIRSIENK